jgi:hypothetical protein
MSKAATQLKGMESAPGKENLRRFDRGLYL